MGVALGDLTGDGVADVVTAPGGGGGPVVKVFDGSTGTLLRSFPAYDAGFRGGLAVAVGDVTGDGVPDIVTAAGAGGAPHVKVFSGRVGETLRSFFAYETAFTGGAPVAARDVDGDGFAEVITGTGPGGGPHVKVFDGRSGSEIRGFFAAPDETLSGVRVGVFDADGDGHPDLLVKAASGPAWARAFNWNTLDVLDGVTLSGGDFPDGTPRG